MIENGIDGNGGYSYLYYCRCKTDEGLLGWGRGEFKDKALVVLTASSDRIFIYCYHGSSNPLSSLSFQFIFLLQN